jgi:hypothetical protein
MLQMWLTFALQVIFECALYSVFSCRVVLHIREQGHLQSLPQFKSLGESTTSTISRSYA